MRPLVLLILASVWAAVFIPPLLRSRIENRTSESVSDFRRQLNKLQTAVPNRAGQMSMARPLAQSPLTKPAATGRPGQPGGRRHGTPSRTLRAATNERTQVRERPTSGRSLRSHGAPGRPTPDRPTPGRRAPRGRFDDRRSGVGPTRRPNQRYDRPDPGRTPPRGHRRPEAAPARGRQAPRQQAHRQTQVHRDTSSAAAAHRRRSNVMMLLVVVTGATLFIAAQTRSTTMVYAFVLSFIALCGYMFMLSQAKQREATDWGADWMS